jgi:hypothetical protein
VEVVPGHYARDGKNEADQHVVPPTPEFGSCVRRGCRTQGEWCRCRRRGRNSRPDIRTVHKYPISYEATVRINRNNTFDMKLSK